MIETIRFLILSEAKLLHESLFMTVASTVLLDILLVFCVAITWRKKGWIEILIVGSALIIWFIVELTGVLSVAGK
jgi:hypothetical protein